MKSFGFRRPPGCDDDNNVSDQIVCVGKVGKRQRELSFVKGKEEGGDLDR